MVPATRFFDINWEFTLRDLFPGDVTGAKLKGRKCPIVYADVIDFHDLGYLSKLFCSQLRGAVTRYVSDLLNFYLCLFYHDVVIRRSLGDETCYSMRPVLNHLIFLELSTKLSYMLFRLFDFQGKT